LKRKFGNRERKEKCGEKLGNLGPSKIPNDEQTRFLHLKSEKIKRDIRKFCSGSEKFSSELFFDFSAVEYLQMMKNNL